MFKIDIYGISITENPTASWRGVNKLQVYTGKMNRKGNPDYETSHGWFETRAEAKAALCDYFAKKAAIYESNAARAKASLDKANSL